MNEKVKPDLVQCPARILPPPHPHRSNAVAGILALPFRLEAVRAGSHREAMKITFTLCLAALCIVTHGQTAKPPVPRDVYAHYLKMGTNIAALKLKVDAAEKAHSEEYRFVAMQVAAGKIPSQQAEKKQAALGDIRLSKITALNKEVASLELRRLEIERKYTLPVVAPDKPEPAKKAKPQQTKPNSVAP